MGKSNSKRVAVLPRFKHTSKDSESNQPLSYQELREFADEHGRFVLITGAKQNRASRRRWKNKK